MDAVIQAFTTLKASQGKAALRGGKEFTSSLEAIVATKELALEVHELALHILLFHEIDCKLEELARELPSLTADVILEMRKDRYNPFDLVNELKANIAPHLALLPRQVTFIKERLSPYEPLFATSPL